VEIGVVYSGEVEYMPHLLSTLSSAATGIDARLLLIDNASADGAEQWQSKFQPVRILRNTARVGFGANMNRILEEASARYVLLLNTDMYFPRDEPCLAKMVRFMDAHPECGVSGCRVYHPDGQYAFPARRFPTPAMILARRFPAGRKLRGPLDRYLYRDRDILSTFQCDWLSGCFLLVRREVLGDVGLFDLRFPKYFEDVDFCLRVGLAGWQVAFYGKTWCYHVEKRASRRWWSADGMRHLASYWRWVRKWGFFPSGSDGPGRPGGGPPARRRASRLRPISAAR
jgi:hypothetical protein